MVSRVHVHQFSASVWRAARSNVASRTYKKKAWNELVGPALQRPAKSQKGASKATLRNGKTAWCRGFTRTNFWPPFGGLRCQTSRPEPTKKRLGMSLSAQHYKDQHRGRKGRQKPPSETATQHGVAGSRAPIFGLRLEGCEVKRRVQKHYKDQPRGRKGRQKPPSEPAKQHGVAGSRAPIFGLRLEGCDVKRRVQDRQKKGLE